MNKPINVSPTEWGPLFWALLSDVAKYSGTMPKSMNVHVENMAKCVPYVLPCSVCRTHSTEIYRKNHHLNHPTTANITHWVWTLRSHVNTYTNSENLKYDQYKLKLSRKNYFITIQGVVDLLYMIALNYPPDDKDRKTMIFYFIKSLSHLVIYIPHLRPLSTLNPINMWNNSNELIRWLDTKVKGLSQR
jgi:hypothetical protein